MPSSPNYKRDYQQEYKTLLARGDRKDHTMRLRARRLAMKKGMVKPHDGMHVDHVVPLSKGGGNAAGNLRVRGASANSSYQRTRTGAMRYRSQK